MRTWLRLGLVTLAVGLGVLAFVQRSQRDAVEQSSPEVTAGQTAAAVLMGALRKGERGSAEGMTWRVLQANAAGNVMVVDVEADRPDEARMIAQEIVQPIADSYVEVLVYVRSRAGTADSNVRRVHWTPDGGYDEIAYNGQ